jgi:hypothetical protein
MYKFNSKEHIHELDGKPLMGTSTVVGVIAKPLTWWASGLACEKFGWISDKKHPPEAVKLALEEGYKRVMGLSLSDYEKLLKEAYKAHSVKLKDSAESGTDLHAVMEDYVKECINTNNGRPFVPATEHKQLEKFANWACENIEEFLWSEVNCYSQELWVGGISDCGAKLKNGKTGIIDFKSSKESYESQFIQIAGYDIQLSENGGFDSEGNQTLKLDKPLDFYAIIPFGAKEFTIDFRYNVDELKEGFKSAVVLWKLTNK